MINKSKEWEGMHPKIQMENTCLGPMSEQEFKQDLSIRCGMEFVTKWDLFQEYKSGSTFQNQH